MAAVRSRDTKPEIEVRQLLHLMGYRYRVHVAQIPGRPDVYFSKRKKVVLVHGCFWHGHQGCPRSALPASNTDFWRAKITKNIARDLANELELAKLGISGLIVWQCQLRDKKVLAKRLKKFLGKPRLA